MQKTIAVDFDGVLHCWDKGWTGYTPTDEPIEGAREFVKKLAGDGYNLIIFII